MHMKRLFHAPSGRIARQFSRIIFYPDRLRRARGNALNTTLRSMTFSYIRVLVVAVPFPFGKSGLRTELIHIVSPAAFRTQHSPVVDFEIIAHRTAGITNPC
jgi:hypothetical protein